MNMKKILGILLALCFLVSVTAGAAGASGNEKKSDWGKDKKSNWGQEKKHDKCFKKVWVKGFWQKIIIKKGHHEVKIIKKWHPGHWKIIKVPCKHYGDRDDRDNGHRR